jgi:uncharacterized protein (DUF1015 family)
LVDIRPFRAIRYTGKAGSAEDLITQPYDKIDGNMQQEYYEKSPYNYCRLILPLEDNKYVLVKQRIEKWLQENVLVKENEPAVFVSRQEFTLDGKTCVRTGLITASRLYDYSENIVFPHETTYSAPKADRLNMLRIAKKNLEPVFLIYSDPKGKTMTFMQEAAKSEPIIEVTDALKVKHTVWKVANRDKIRQLQVDLADKTVVITDGHHRYESAVAYRDEMRRKGARSESLAYNFHMSMLVPVQDEGLVVLPTHRLLKREKITDRTLEALNRFFKVTEIGNSVAALDCFLESHRNEHAFCIYTIERAYGLLLRHEDGVYEFVSAKASKETKLFDVIILRDVIFKTIMQISELIPDEDLFFVRWTKHAVEKVDKGEASVAFLVNPINAKTVVEIAQKHDRLPEKSTDFYPKMVSGLMMMDISEHEKL